MKKIILILPLLLMVVAIQSCTDKLNNVQPSTSISQQQALSTAGAIKAVRAGMYAFFHTGEYTTDYMLYPEALADNIYNRTGISRLSGVSQNTERAGVMDDAGNGNGRNGYDISYDIINQANLLIHGIPKDVIPKSLKKQYRGEAYFIRAFVYHHLVRTLGYAPGKTPDVGEGKGWTKGVPIVTQPTLAESDAEYHPRSSVVDVYNLIISDLNKAIKLLNGNSAGTPIYPSKAAAEAELARVYLYAAGDQQDFPNAFQNANKYATRAIQDAASMGVHVAKTGEVATMFNEKNGLNPAGIWVLQFKSTVTLPGGNLNVSLNVFTANQWVAGVPTQDVMNLYSKNDARLAWFGRCYDDVGSKSVSGCRASLPYVADGQKLELQKWGGEVGNFLDDVPYLRVAEMLLIQSEARLRGKFGNPNKPLNTLRTNRGLDKITGTVTMTNILDARRREFIGEGMRFWDLKRLGRDIRKAPNATGIPSTMAFSNHKVLGNFPNGAVSQSHKNAPKDSVLIQNPGYRQ